MLAVRAYHRALLYVDLLYVHVRTSYNISHKQGAREEYKHSHQDQWKTLLYRAPGPPTYTGGRTRTARNKMSGFSNANATHLEQNMMQLLQELIVQHFRLLRGQRRIPELRKTRQ